MDEYFKPFKTRTARVLSDIKNPEGEACVLSSKQRLDRKSKLANHDIKTSILSTEKKNGNLKVTLRKIN